ncbi:MAG: D-alanyl-D-alanine carboxypeptidase family protein [Streptosporangiaceae bacterium]
MPTPRSARLIAVFLTVVSLLLVVGAPLGSAALSPATDSIEALKKQATKARNELDGLDRTWKAQAKKLTGSQNKLKDTLKRLGQANAEFEQLRGPLARLANSASQAPAASGSMSLFGLGDPVDGLRSSADLGFLARSHEALIKTASDLKDRQTKLADDAQELQSGNAVESARIAKQKKFLFGRINQLTTQLTTALQKLSGDRDLKLRLSCDAGLVADSTKFPNGLIPNKYLCKLPQKDSYLRADAALAFYKLNAAYKKRFGHDMCVTDAYRSLRDQQRLYYQRPGYAAVPGRSNHGLGQALDLCDGVQSQGSTTFTWLRANSQTYGWFHPAWAYSSPFEPWHWEFGTDSAR